MIFFARRSDAYPIASVFGYCRNRYSLDATLFDSFDVNDLRVYVDNNAETIPLKTSGVIGMNFLKRFNVYFDFSTKQVGFLPIKNYVRVIDPYIKRCFYTTRLTEDRSLIVLTVNDIPDNYYKQSGLQAGDRIVAVNGYQMNGQSRQANDEMRYARRKEINILREGNPIKIVVSIDVKEPIGE